MTLKKNNAFYTTRCFKVQNQIDMYLVYFVSDDKLSDVVLHSKGSPLVHYCTMMMINYIFLCIALTSTVIS